jgi:hypothetical protein
VAQHFRSAEQMAAAPLASGHTTRFRTIPSASASGDPKAPLHEQSRSIATHRHRSRRPNAPQSVLLPPTVSGCPPRPRDVLACRDSRERPARPRSDDRLTLRATLTTTGRTVASTCARHFPHRDREAVVSTASGVNAERNERERVERVRLEYRDPNDAGVLPAPGPALVIARSEARC